MPNDRVPGRTALTFVLMVAMIAGSRGVVHAEAPAVSFKRDVQPILEQHCIVCHTPNHVGHQAIGLDLSTYNGVRNGSSLGMAVIPYQPQFSSLLMVLDWNGRRYLKMPPVGHQLSAQKQETIRAWIVQGAKDN